MDEFFSDIKIKKVFFIGIGGVSMSGIANYLLDNGYTVYGTDINKSDTLYNLEKKGVKLFYKFSEKILDIIDAIIYTSAINDDNLWLKYAKEKNIPIFKRSVVLGSIINKYRNSIGVSGSHGKTTVTSMISEIFINAKRFPTIFLGGENVKFGNYMFGKDDYVIYEACEFRKNFLDMKPTCSVVLNIDNDHLDSYRNIDEEVVTFSDFISKSVSFINTDDKYCKKINTISSITYGIKNKAVYNAKNIAQTQNTVSFELFKYGKKIAKINLNIAGEHNVYNAMVAYAVADHFKIEKDLIIKSLNNFSSVKRRNEFLGKINNTNIFADYAHHPTELLAMYNQYKNLMDNTLFIFQPHTFSRTKFLFNEFIDVLSKYKHLFIFKTYSAREKYDYLGSAEYLAEEIAKINPNVKYYTKLNDMDKIFSEYNNIIFLGAGDIYDIALSFIKKELRS